MNPARVTLLLLGLLPLAGCGEIMKGVIVLGALQGDLETGRSARTKLADGFTIDTASLAPPGDGPDALHRLADALAAGAPDAIALRDAGPAVRERLLDELWRREARYEAAVAEGEHAILVRDGAGVVPHGVRHEPDGWASARLPRPDGPVLLIVTGRIGSSADALLDAAALAGSGVVVACGHRLEDDAVGRLLAEGFQPRAEAPLGGLLLGRALGD